MTELFYQIRLMMMMMKITFGLTNQQRYHFSVAFRLVEPCTQDV